MSVPNFTKSYRRDLWAAIDSHGTRMTNNNNKTTNNNKFSPDGGILNIAASSNEVAKHSYDPENI